MHHTYHDVWEHAAHQSKRHRSWCRVCCNMIRLIMCSLENGAYMQQSIFYHVPIDLMDKLMEYRTNDSIFHTTWRFRKPKNGFIYGHGGSLRRKNANVASLYIKNDFEATNRSLQYKINEQSKQIIHKCDELDNVFNQLTNVKADFVDMIDDMDNVYNTLENVNIELENVKKSWGYRLQKWIESFM